MICEISYGSILFSSERIFHSVRLVFVFSSDKNREFSGGVCRLFSAFAAAGTRLTRRSRLRYIRIHIAFGHFLPLPAQKKRRHARLHAAVAALFIFLIVLRKDALDLLLGLHDLVVKALCRHAHRTVPENDQLL